MLQPTESSAPIFGDLAHPRGRISARPGTSQRVLMMNRNADICIRMHSSEFAHIGHERKSTMPPRLANRSRVAQLDGIVDRTHEVTAPTYSMPVTPITNDRPVRYECF
jgi:hypothetical protein